MIVQRSVASILVLSLVLSTISPALGMAAETISGHERRRGEGVRAVPDDFTVAPVETGEATDVAAPATEASIPTADVRDSVAADAELKIASPGAARSGSEIKVVPAHEAAPGPAGDIVEIAPVAPSAEESAAALKDPLIGKIEAAMRNGRWGSAALLFDNAAKTGPADVDEFGGRLRELPEARLTRLEPHESEDMAVAVLTNGDDAQPVLYLSPSGLLLPVHGSEVISYVKSGQLALYTAESDHSGPATILVPASVAAKPAIETFTTIEAKPSAVKRPSGLARLYSTVAQSALMQRILRRPKIEEAAPAAVPSRLADHDAELDALVSEATRQGTQIRLAREQFEQSLAPSAKDRNLARSSKQFNEALVAFKKDRDEWKRKRDALLAKAASSDRRFLQAVLDAADFVKHQGDLSAGSLLARRFHTADALLAFLYPKEIEALRKLIPSSSRVHVDINDIPYSVLANPELVREMLSITEEGRREGAAINEAIEIYKRVAEPDKEGPAKAWSDLKPVLLKIRSDHARWKERRDEFYRKTGDLDPSLASYAFSMVDIDSTHDDKPIGRLLIGRFSSVDALLAAVFPEHIEELRVVHTTYPDLDLPHFEGSYLALQTLIFSQIQSSVLFNAEIQNELFLLAKEAKEESAPMEASLDRLQKTIHDSGSSSEGLLGILKAYSEFKEDNERYTAARAPWNARKDTLYGKVGRYELAFFKLLIDAVDFKRKHGSPSLGAILGNRFKTADELLAVLYPEDIEALRLYIPNLAELSVVDFEQSIFMNPALVREFIESRKSLRKEEIQPAGGLSRVQFKYVAQDIPSLLERLEKMESGVLKTFEPGLRALAEHALPFHERLHEAFEALKGAISESKPGDEISARLTAFHGLVEENRKNAAVEKTRAALMELPTSPGTTSFLNAVLSAFAPNQSIDSLIGSHSSSADGLLESIYPDLIADLRRFIPNLAKLGISGFEQSIFLSRDRVLGFVETMLRIERLGATAKVQPSDLANLPHMIPFSGGTLRSRAKFQNYLLPYRIEGLEGIGDYNDPENLGYATIVPDPTPADRKAALRGRFEVFSELIDANFRVLPMMNALAAKPMPKSAGRAVVSELGNMVALYESLTKSANQADQGKAVRAKYDALVAEIEKLWKDLPDSSDLPHQVVERIEKLEPGAKLPKIQNLHTLVNYMHQQSFQYLQGMNGRTSSGSVGKATFRNEWSFLDLSDDPPVVDGRVRSKPLAALLQMEKYTGRVDNSHDVMIIRGDELWAHVTLGAHSAEIYVKLAAPDDGGMLRVRYQEWTADNVGNPMRLSMVKEQMRLLGIHSEVEDPVHLLSVLDKDHGLNSEAEVQRLLPFVLKTVKDTVDMNLNFNHMGKRSSEAAMPRLASSYVANGTWLGMRGQMSSTHGDFTEFLNREEGSEATKQRAQLREALNKELERLGLPAIPEDILMGQVAIDRYFTLQIHQALLRGELRRDDKGIPQRQDFRPVEDLLSSVRTDPDQAGDLASILRHFETELDYEPIGAVGGLIAERAVQQFGERALIVYGFRDPETGALAYARAQVGEPGIEPKELSVAALRRLLKEEGRESPEPESLSGAQKAALDRLLRTPTFLSPLSGHRISGLAASAGKGGFITAPVTFKREGKAGEVLIVPYTEPDDIDAIKKSAAVVTTGGGFLSHAAITTRELGLPSVILPKAEWKQDEKGEPYLELVYYDPTGDLIQRDGMNIRPQMQSTRIQLKEGDVIRVNGATGEVYVFPESTQAPLKKILIPTGPTSKSIDADNAAFVVEEALFNPAHRSWRAGIERLISNQPSPIARRFGLGNSDNVSELMQRHAQRLLDDRSDALLASAPDEKEASEASIDAFADAIAELDDAIRLFGLKRTGLLPLKKLQRQLYSALDTRSNVMAGAALGQIIAAMKGRDLTTDDLPLLRRSLRVIEKDRSIDNDKALRSLSDLEKALTKKKQAEIAKQAPSVLPLGAVDDDYRSLVGGKLSKLGEILAVVRKEGGYVPEAIAVTTEAYRRYLRENNLEMKLNALATKLEQVLSKKGQNEEARQAEVKALSEQIRKLLQSGKLDPKQGVGKEIWAAMQARGLDKEGKQLAIRSSAVQEDQADAAFAGAAESYLHVKPEEALAKVLENWASFWLPRGIVYRHDQRIPQTELLPSTIIQEMAQADVAGVLFTQNPVTGQNEIVINAAYGLGEGIVSGIVQTDRFVARKSDGEETKLPFVGDKRVAIRPNASGSGTGVQGVAIELRKRRSLTLDQTRRLARIATALEDHFGYPLDIEFAIQGDQIAILQARPVTVKGGNEQRRDRVNNAGIRGPSVAPVVVRNEPIQLQNARTATVPAVGPAPNVYGVGTWGGGWMYASKPTPAQIEKLRRLKEKKITFVCAGNSCRSPMAELVAKDLLNKAKDTSVKVVSRGVHTIPGNRISSGSYYFLKDRGINGEGHVATRLTEEDVRTSDVILAMDSTNVREISARFPESKGKLFLLKDFADGDGYRSDVANPFTEIENSYRGTAFDIKVAIDAIARAIKATPEAKVHSILFASSFNTGRGPMAEYIARDIFTRDRITGVQVHSRAVDPDAKPGLPMAAPAMDLFRNSGIDVRAHRSTPITAEDIRNNDLILVMEQSHFDEIVSRFPEAKNKTFLLREFSGVDKWRGPEIADPSDRINHVYRTAGTEIMDAVEGALERISPPFAAAARAAAEGSRLLLFICSGNHSRSPLAERLFKDFLRRKGITDIQVQSRGLTAMMGGPMNPLSHDVLRRRRIVYDDHFGRPLTKVDVRKAGALLVMEPFQKADLERRFPEAKGKVHLLTEYAGLSGPILDNPKSVEVFEYLTGQIVESLEGILERFKS